MCSTPSEFISKSFYLLVLLISFQISVPAQDTLNIAFGRISTSDFNVAVPKSDTGAGAVIIADIGKTYYDAGKQGGLVNVYTRFIRVKILNNKGLDIGQYQIRLGNLDNYIKESLSEIKATTYNFVNGKIVESKLTVADQYVTKINNNFNVTKFAMPALKVGSIYDLSYTIRSPFIQVRNWEFQTEYPCLWSEYLARIPSLIHFRMKIQGDQQFDIHQDTTVFEEFSIENSYYGRNLQVAHFSGYSSQIRRVKKNVEGLRDEPYMSSVRNFADRMSFFLEYFQWNNNDLRHLDLSSWATAADRYLSQNDLGESLNDDNIWMEKDLYKFTDRVDDKELMARDIYYFVREHFTSTGYSGFYPQHTLKEIYKNRSGSSAEINLLLTAMLRHEKLDADPAILSTRENGFANLDYPLLTEYNDLICILYLDGREVTLDASISGNPFGRIPANCYNGGARTLSKNISHIIPLSADSLLERQLTNIIISNDGNNRISGRLTSKYGMENSAEIRQEIRKNSKEDYFKKIITANVDHVELLNADFDSLGSQEQPLMMHCDLNFKEFGKSDLIYFTPVLTSFADNNPFSETDRKYPVEMPYKKDYVYLLTMDIPNGYKVDELPKPAMIRLNDQDGMFEYAIQQETDEIQIRLRLKLNKTRFNVEEYPSLREFYTYVVKKESEKIVFKKIN